MHEVGAVITILESDEAILDAFQSGIGHGDAENVPAQVLKDPIARTGMLTVDNPVVIPDLARYLLQKTGFFQGRTYLRLEDQRQSPDGNQELGIFGLDPLSAIP